MTSALLTLFSNHGYSQAVKLSTQAESTLITALLRIKQKKYGVARCILAQVAISTVEGWAPIDKALYYACKAELSRKAAESDSAVSLKKCYSSIKGSDLDVENEVILSAVVLAKWIEQSLTLDIESSLLSELACSLDAFSRGVCDQSIELVEIPSVRPILEDLFKSANVLCLLLSSTGAKEVGAVIATIAGALRNLGPLIKRDLAASGAEGDKGIPGTQTPHVLLAENLLSLFGTKKHPSDYWHTVSVAVCVLRSSDDDKVCSVEMLSRIYEQIVKLSHLLRANVPSLFVIVILLKLSAQIQLKEKELQVTMCLTTLPLLLPWQEIFNFSANEQVAFFARSICEEAYCALHLDSSSQEICQKKLRELLIERILPILSIASTNANNQLSNILTSYLTAALSKVDLAQCEDLAYFIKKASAAAGLLFNLKPVAVPNGHSLYRQLNDGFYVVH